MRQVNNNAGRTDVVRQKVIDMQAVKRLEVPEDLVAAILAAREE